MATHMELITTDEAGNIVERRIVTNTVRVRCDMCQEIIATLDRAAANLPLMGSMFSSADPHHGLPDPFPPDQEWLYMQCPHCHARPFTAEDPAICVHIVLEDYSILFVRKKGLISPVEPSQEEESSTESLDPVVESVNRPPCASVDSGSEGVEREITAPAPPSPSPVEVVEEELEAPTPEPPPFTPPLPPRPVVSSPGGMKFTKKSSKPHK